MSNAIEFCEVWKKYRKGEKFNSLRDAVPNLMRQFSKNGMQELTKEEFWAVKDVSFQIPKGDVVGVMGSNGAGKSTILKLLSGIIVPTKGEMKINGRVSALIEVTAGFHPELTGRENVFLNGTILGMSRKEIEHKFDEIVEFSGVEEFIDTPVKRYSSGMYSRLGFSVAAHMDPEILIVDEVLSVGDVSFQAKCAQKMRELLKSGATILLVSHQISLVQSLCKRVILLNHGEVIKDGDTDEVVPYYQDIIFKKSEDDFKRKVSSTEKVIRPKQELLMDITNVEILSEDKERKDGFVSGESISFKINYFAKKPIESPIIIVDILRSDGVLCCSLNSKDQGIALDEIYEDGSVEILFDRMNLNAGIYLIKIAFWERSMIHPFITRSCEVIRIVPGDGQTLNDAVFVPQVRWQLNGREAKHLYNFA
jgi:lipopolysaccharide transport system ATP-binding protein